MNPRTELWLVRHAESTGNRDGLLQGQADLPLSPMGHRQARALADRLVKSHRRTPFSALIASDLMRTRETADSASLALNLPITCDRRLREIDIGTWSGLTPEQITTQFPEEWARWQGRDPNLRRGGGESYTDAHDRITPALHDIADRHPGTRILVITHGGVLRAYLAGLLGMPLNRLWHLSIGNTAITRVRPYEPAVGGSEPHFGRVLTMNDCAHVEDLAMRSGEV